jgi:hypothetical protein
MSFRIVTTLDNFENHEGKVEAVLRRIEDNNDVIVGVNSGQYESERVSSSGSTYKATVYFTHITWRRGFRSNVY